MAILSIALVCLSTRLDRPAALWGCGSQIRARCKIRLQSPQSAPREFLASTYACGKQERPSGHRLRQSFLNVRRFARRPILRSAQGRLCGLVPNRVSSPVGVKCGSQPGLNTSPSRIVVAGHPVRPQTFQTELVGASWCVRGHAALPADLSSAPDILSWLRLMMAFASRHSESDDLCESTCVAGGLLARTNTSSSRSAGLGASCGGDVDHRPPLHQRPRPLAAPLRRRRGGSGGREGGRSRRAWLSLDIGVSHIGASAWAPRPPRALVIFAALAVAINGIRHHTEEATSKRPFDGTCKRRGGGRRPYRAPRAVGRVRARLRPPEAAVALHSFSGRGGTQHPRLGTMRRSCASVPRTRLGRTPA